MYESRLNLGVTCRERREGVTDRVVTTQPTLLSTVYFYHSTCLPISPLLYRFSWSRTSIEVCSYGFYLKFPIIEDWVVRYCKC